MITTEHKGHTIAYDEDTNKWECRALDMSAPSLKTLQKKIDDFEAKERKLGENGVRLLFISNYRFSNKRYSEVRATMLDKSEDFHAVWITHISNGQREKVGLHSLMLDTPENRKAIDDAEALEKEAKAMDKKAEKMKADIPRITKEQIKAMALEAKPE